MNWLATPLVMLALAACAQGGQIPYAPYPPENDTTGTAGRHVAGRIMGPSADLHEPQVAMHRREGARRVGKGINGHIPKDASGASRGHRSPV
jgi:hypothetical protein